MLRPRLALAVAVVLVAFGAVPAAEGHVIARSAAVVGAHQVEIALSSPAESAFLSASSGRVKLRADDDHRIIVRSGDPEVDVRILSRDGHVTTVHLDQARPGSPTIATLQVRDPLPLLLGRLLTLCGLVMIVGSLVVSRWVVLPAIRNPLRTLGRDAPPWDGDLERDLSRRVAHITVLAAVAGTIGVLLSIVSLLHRLATRDIATLLSTTRTGQAIVVSLLALASSIALQRLRKRQLDNFATLAAVGICALALVTISATGHATAGRDALLGGLFDAVHLMATAIWVGGLCALLAGWHEIQARADNDSVGRVGAMVVRFSSVAIGCVAALVVTGTYRTLAELSTFSDLVNTSYGRALTLKLLVFAPLLGVGAINRFVVHPRLERAGIGLADSDRAAIRLLGTSLRTELALAAVLLGVLGVMIGFPPPG